MNKLKWVFGSIGLLLLIIIIILAVAFFSINGAVSTADKQFKDIKKGDYQAAYDLFSANGKTKTSFDQFQLSFAQMRVNTDKNSRLIFNNRRVNGNTANLVGILTSNGNANTITYSLVQENGSWRIYSINIRPR